MASRKRGSRTRKRRGDPGQLNLFDAPVEEARARAKRAAPLRVKTKRLKAASVERSVAFSPQEAATYIGVTVSTLKSWRAKKIGPKWTHRGVRLICYFPEDLDAFLRRGPRGPDKS
ncbi:MAG: helix-turn-helix domain-containing protein [Hyphomonadaceae bacterium]|nr:helix-turn-helix domain-containing protein [Hyphomonadaceae bacterium]